MVLVCAFGLMIFILAVCPQVSAITEDLEGDELIKVQNNFARYQAATRTYQAEFVQTLKLKGHKAPTVSKGSIFYSGPDALLLKYTQPTGEYVLVQGNKVLVKKTGRKPVRHHLGEDRQPGILMLLGLFQGQTNFRERYHVSMKQIKKEVYVELSRLAEVPASRFDPEQIELVLVKNRRELKSIKVILPKGNSINFEFRFIRRNRVLDIDPNQWPPTTPIIKKSSAKK